MTRSHAVLAALLVSATVFAWYWSGSGDGTPDPAEPTGGPADALLVAPSPDGSASGIPLTGDFPDSSRTGAPPRFGPGDLPALLETVAETTDEDQRQDLQFEISLLASPRAVRLIVEAYRGAPTDEVRETLADTLQMMTTEAVLPEVTRIITTPGVDALDPLSRAARRVLVRLGTPYTVDFLAGRLNEASATEQSIYGEALSAVKADPAIDELLLLAQGRRPELATTPVRAAATAALRNYPLSLTRRTLAALAEDADPVIAETAQRVILVTRE